MKHPAQHFIRIERKTAVAVLAVAVLVAAAYGVISETMKVTTYYPAPAGIYQRLTTTSNTTLARDGGQSRVSQESKEFG